MDVSKRVIVLLTVVFVNICFFNYVHGSATNNGTQGEGVPPMPISTKGNKYRAIFVFGDSLVDAGNNNYLNISLAKAFNRPNGIDFPSPNASNPTGRFTNGLTIVDMIGMKLGMNNVVPPFLAPTTKGAAILNGVNYASGGAGILNDTGRIFLQYISLDEQLGHFEQTKEELNALLGLDEAKNLINNALYTIVVGSNDFLDNYLFPIHTTVEPNLPPEDFIVKLITCYKPQIKSLYNAGARKIIVANVPYIGCIPYFRYLKPNAHGKCFPKANELANAFNGHLKDMLNELSNDLPGVTILHADAYGIMSKITNNYQDYGFTNADKPCCGQIGSTKLIPCRFPFLSVCENRAKYFYWDAFHPTQSAYEIIAHEIFDGNEFISPINIRGLMDV